MKKIPTILILFISILYSCSNSTDVNNNKFENLKKESQEKKQSTRPKYVHKQIKTLEIGDTIILYNGIDNGIREVLNKDSIIGIIDTIANYTSEVKYHLWDYVNGRIIGETKIAGFHMTTYYFNAKIGYEYSSSYLFLLDKDSYTKNFECENNPYSEKASDRGVEFIVK